MSAGDVVERYLTTGSYDPLFREWEGPDRRKRGTETLRQILQRVVAHRAQHAPIPARRAPPHSADLVRERVRPLVTGLFPAEAPVLLDTLPGRVAVLTLGGFPDAVAAVPLSTAWDLANLLLDDLGVPPLSDDTPELDGLCAAGRAWVLPRAFAPPTATTDVIVHEVTHLLHLLRRGDVGLEPARAPVLSVPPRRRETFAYACELWCCLTRDGSDDLPARLAALRSETGFADARVDRATLEMLLQTCAATPPEGWGVLRRWGETGRVGP